MSAKRIFDIFFSMTALVILSPLMVILAILVYAFLGRPVLFRQKRPGLNGKIFDLYKFRSMNETKDETGNLLPDAERLTRFGRFLRSTSLDELPELVNVLKGDMSIVGPRPLLVDYLPLYTPEQMRRHNMRPGITGWAQVNGRNAISWEEKFKYDVWYIDNWSLLLDLKIIAMTAAKVVKREGITQEGESTMGRFEGTKE